jgi:alkyl hydroperoxide reductase subunit AhpC
MRFLAVCCAFAALALCVHWPLSSASSPHLAHPSAVLPRMLAPHFQAVAVIDEKFHTVSLRNYTEAGKWVVLLFYPFDFTFVCPTEIISFSERIDEFHAIGAEVLGISTDSHHTHLAWIRTPRSSGGLGKVGFPLVADTSKAISRNYGVLVDDESDDMYGAALRGLFIIDARGIIRSVQINDDHVGRNVDEAIRLIQAYRFADTHGEVCPANWKPGDPTMKPDPEASKSYFHSRYDKKDSL